MNNFINAAAVIAIVSVFTFCTPLHPVVGVVGLAIALFTGIWGIGVYEDSLKNP